MAMAIEASGVVKSFGKTRALNGLNLSVRVGEVHGLLGPNGAGKSTTIRILLGLLRADAGAVRLLGSDPWRDATTLYRRLAHVPGGVSLWPDLTGGEVIDLLGGLRGGLDSQRRSNLLTRFKLDPGMKCRAYSEEERQQVALVAALASPVELLLLDEPTAGFNPALEAAFRECIAEERARGRTILLSGHILSGVETLCDRVTIIRDGRRVEDTPLAGLHQMTRVSITAEVAAPPTTLSYLEGISHVDIEGNRICFSVDTQALDAALCLLVKAGIRHLISRPDTSDTLCVS